MTSMSIYDDDREIQQAEFGLSYDELGRYNEDIYTSESRSNKEE